MCGIVGYIGPRDATPIILNGLKRLEYRGYDSAGIAILDNGDIKVRREAGKLNKLLSLVEKDPISGHLGIGHTRCRIGQTSIETPNLPHVESQLWLPGATVADLAISILSAILWPRQLPASVS